MLGSVTMLVNCAGYAVAQKFEDTEIDDFKVGNFVYRGNIVAVKQILYGRS